jgi:N-acetylmuramoyl-L-alanine amidase
VKLSFVLPLAAIAILGLSKSAWAGKLLYWKFNKPLNRIEFITNEGVQPQAKFVANPARLIIDIPDTTVDKSKQRKKSNVTRFIKEVRVGQLNRNTARLVVELGSQYTLRADDVKIRSFSPNRWFVQIPNAVLVDSAIATRNPTPIEIDMPDGIPWPMPKPVPPNRRFPWAVLNPTPPSKRIPFPDLPPVEMPPPIEEPTQAPEPSVRIPVKTSVNPPARAGTKVVVIDPGHGGRDPGAVGNGLQEKKIVYAVSLQVAEQLRRNGIRVVLTRPGDREVDLEPRVAKARRAKANVFVSIHANAISMSRPEVNGLETYYYSGRQGYRLARAVHSSLLGAVNLRDRGTRKARFYVIRRTSMPAVLIEIGYITGSQDSIKLASAAERTKIATAISQGILNYFQRK